MHQPGVKGEKVLPAEVSRQQGCEATALQAPLRGARAARNKEQSKEQVEKRERKLPAWRNPARRDPRSWATRGVPSPEHHQVNASGRRKRHRARGPSLGARAVPTLISFPSPQLPRFLGTPLPQPPAGAVSSGSLPLGARSRAACCSEQPRPPLPNELKPAAPGERPRRCSEPKAALG